MRILLTITASLLLSACENPRGESSDHKIEAAKRTTESIQMGEPRARFAPPESWNLSPELEKGEFARKAEALLDEAEKRVQAVADARIQEHREGGTDLGTQKEEMGRVQSMVQIARRYLSDLEAARSKDLEMYDKGRVQALLEEIRRESLGHSGIPFDKVSNFELPE